MSVELIKEKITKLITQKETTPPTYILNIFKEFNDVYMILKALKELIKSNDFETFINAGNFLTITMNNPKYIPGKISDAYITSIENDYEFFEALQDKLKSNNLFIRQQTIDTLGELRYEESLNFLNDVFDYYLDNDPISLPLIIKALIHLTDEIPWDKIQKITDSKNFIARWSFLGIFEITNLDYDLSYKYLSLLSQDNENFIEEEAKYRINILKTEQASIEKGAVTNSQEHDNKPKVLFSELIKNYHDYLEDAKQADYEIEELKIFIKFYIEDHDTLVNKFKKFKERSKN